MPELMFIKDYKESEKLRASFNDLATLVFGIDFEEWYQKGYWTTRYIPFSYVDEDKVVANVSVNLLDFVFNGEKKKAVQLGTVMTHPNYRNRGLSARLINMVLEEYENNYDFIYLFANQRVLNFYPKFGFKPVQEYKYSMDYSPIQPDATGFHKLDGRKSDDLKFIYKFASERVPVSTLFGTEHTQDLLMFYCIYVFSNYIYYLENEDAIVVFKQEDNEVHIFDLVSKTEVNIKKILSKITNDKTQKIVFHFTPDYKGIHTQSESFTGGDILFVKARGDNTLPLNIKHPLTSKA